MNIVNGSWSESRRTTRRGASLCVVSDNGFTKTEIFGFFKVAARSPGRTRVRKGKDEKGAAQPVLSIHTFLSSLES